MKIVIFVSLLCGLFVPYAFSQNTEHGHFVKRIEYNFQSQIYLKNNLNSKGNIEKLFFGDFNALVEFSYLPSNESAFEEPPSGFRTIIDTSSTSYILEIKYISNYAEAEREAEREAKEEQNRLLINLPVEVLNSLPRDIFNQIWDYNRSISNRGSYLKRYFEELPKHFKVEILSFPISDQFAEKLYEKMVSLIDSFRAKGIPPTIIDGYSTTFRTVVDDEVWSLNIHMPQGNALKIADLCRQIITDACAGKLDEKKYIAILNTFED